MPKDEPGNLPPFFIWKTRQKREIPPGLFPGGRYSRNEIALLERRIPENCQSEEDLRQFLRPSLESLPSPFEMPHAREAARKILGAIDGKRKIAVFGDFDADGICATAILYDMIRALGGIARPFIPLRREGYGLTDEAVERLLAEEKPDLAVTVDCGISASRKIEELLAMGVDVVVTDHHTEQGPLPDGVTVLTPHSCGTEEFSSSLCGAGVAFKLAYAMVLMRYPDKTSPQGKILRKRLVSWLDALAIATIADVVPLKGENRVLAAAGISRINKSPRPGIRELVKATMGEENPAVRSYHVGFILAPHINAAGRMASAMDALQLLLAESEEEAAPYAKKLKEYCDARKKEESRTLEEALAMLADKETFDPERDGAIAIAREGWHPGVLGLVAARLSERFRRPAMVASSGHGAESVHGSVRAPKGYDAFGALKANGGLLEGFGGHTAAAGVTLRPEMMEAFRKGFSREARKQANGASLRPECEIDLWLDPCDLTVEFAAFAEKLEPFGEGNPPILAAIPAVSVKAYVVGKGERKHLKLKIENANAPSSVSPIWFGRGDLKDHFASFPKWDIIGYVSSETFAGEEHVRFSVLDARPSQQDA